ncbi:ComEC/Rec2 family competence protein [bacterium]|nr:ComEC/Rec2 family competence protein [bacterium]
MVLIKNHIFGFNPGLFLALLLLPFLSFFTDLQYWWPLQVGIQIIICLTGLCFPRFRKISVPLLVLVLYLNFQWFQPFRQLPEICQKQVDHLTGISKSDSFHSNSVLNLIKVEVWCKGESVKWPSAVVELSKIPERGKTWYQVGDRIEFTKIKIKKNNAWGLSVKPLYRFKIFNLSKKNGILNRNHILIYIQSKIRYYLDGFPRAVSKSLITADRGELGTVWKLRFQHLGISHIFAISGMHIGILYLWLSLFLRVLISFPVSLINKGYGIILTDVISIALIYLFLDTIGMPISARRSLTMLTWWVAVRHFLPWHPLWFVLLGVAILILLEQPFAIGQASFQLSFLSVFGILIILPFLPNREYNDSVFVRLYKTVFSIMIISLWLFFFTFPLILRLNPTFSLVSVFNNVIHILFLSFLFFPLLLITLLITILGLPFGGFPGEIYFYSMVNLCAKFWEWLLLWNDSLNISFLWKPEFEFNIFYALVFWSFLLVFPSLVFSLKKHSYQALKRIINR